MTSVEVILHSLATRIPVVKLRRIDEIINDNMEELEDFEDPALQNVVSVKSEEILNSFGESYNYKSRSAKATRNRCNFCSVTFLSKVKLNAHMKHCASVKMDKDNDHTKSYSSKKVFSCALCTETFSSKFQLIQHVSLHCEDGVNYTYEHHETIYSSVTSLKGYIKKEKSQGWYICPVCSKSFRTKNSITDHIKSHKKQTPYSCACCNKHFKQRKRYIEHIESHSTATKHYDCHICSKSYPRAEYLKNHLNKHMGLKPFECSICHKSYTTKSHLNEHFVIHSGYKAYECPVCNKYFFTVSRRTKHMNIHKKKQL